MGAETTAKEVECVLIYDEVLQVSAISSAPLCRAKSFPSLSLLKSWIHMSI